MNVCTVVLGQENVELVQFYRNVIKADTFVPGEQRAIKRMEQHILKERERSGNMVASCSAMNVKTPLRMKFVRRVADYWQTPAFVFQLQCM